MAPKASAAATASKPAAAKKSSPPEHPPYKEMVKEAILSVSFSSTLCSVFIGEYLCLIVVRDTVEGSQWL